MEDKDRQTERSRRKTIYQGAAERQLARLKDVRERLGDEKWAKEVGRTTALHILLSQSSHEPTKRPSEILLLTFVA